MRVLLATDQPFWRCRGGAQQRISCLWDAFRQKRAPATESPATESPATLVYYLGDPQWVPDSGSHDAIGHVVAACREHSVATSPVWSWFATGWKSASEGWARRLADVKDTRLGASPHSLSLSDYRWSWVEKHWNATLERFRPDIVILEYVTMTYLIDYANRSQRNQIVWAVDTHDCLSQRAAQFTAAGEDHWLEISEAAEIAALEPADLVIAIQDPEREWFAHRLRKPRVIVAGHAPQPSSASATDGATDLTSTYVEQPGERSTGGPSELRLGFLASNNFPNRHGIANWLSRVAPHLHNYSLVIGGSIGTTVEELLDSDECWASVRHRVRCLGDFEDLAEFYREIDVVICPIVIGTGLKIKLVEGLSFNCPVLATPEATEHWMDLDTGVVVCATPESWVKQINELSTDRNQLALLRQQATKFANISLRPDVVYGELFRELQALVQQKNEARLEKENEA